MLFGKTKKLLEEKEKEIILNLSNNYKDSAYEAYTQYMKLINQLKDEGKIGERDFEKLNSKILEFRVKFKSYIKQFGI